MSVNGPMKMYKIKPLYDISPPINLPTCMYKMKNLYTDSHPAKETKEVSIYFYCFFFSLPKNRCRLTRDFYF